MFQSGLHRSEESENWDVDEDIPSRNNFFKAVPHNANSLSQKGKIKKKPGNQFHLFFYSVNS